MAISLKPFPQVLAELAPLASIIFSPEDAEFYATVTAAIQQGNGAQIQTMPILQRLNAILADTAARSRLKSLPQVIAELDPLEMIIFSPDDAAFYQSIKMSIEMGEAAQVQSLTILQRLNKILNDAQTQQYR